MISVKDFFGSATFFDYEDVMTKHVLFGINVADQYGDKTLLTVLDISVLHEALENLNGHKENDCIIVSISEDQREKALKAIEVVKEANVAYKKLSFIKRRKMHFVDFFWHYLHDTKQELFNDKVVRDFSIIASRNVSDLETIKPIDIVVRNAMDIVRNYQK